MGIEVFKKHLREKRAIKLSLGANNDINKSIMLANSAQTSHASAIDIPCDKNIFKAVKKITKIPIFTSSMHPFKLKEALEWGVDSIEIGNYESLRKKQNMYSANDIYNIVLETMGLANEYDTFISVCIPREISYSDKLSLIKKLEILGVDLIRVEGLSLNHEMNELIEIANSSIIPVICLAQDEKSFKKIFETGFAGIDIEFITQKYNSQTHMTNAVMLMVGSLSSRNSLNKEIIRTNRELFRI